MTSIPQIQSVRTSSMNSKKHSKPSSTGGIFNIPFLVVIVLLVSFGLLVVYSAVSGNPNYSFKRQVTGVLVGIVVMSVIWNFDYSRLAGMSKIFLFINIVLILSPHLPVIGVTTMGATSWIDIGMQVQPGEFAKVTVILLDAAIMAEYRGRLDEPIEYLKVLGLMMVPFVCIMTQPDLGTGLVYIFIAGVSLVMGGARLKYLLITFGACVALVAAVFAIDQVIFNATGEYVLLKQYQRNRLLVFMYQDTVDLSEEGYNLEQAKIAIGSGGLFGQGYLQGSQHSLGILPEAPTDFIFCVLAEEFGFAGVIVLIFLYIALVTIGIKIALSSNDMFGLLIVTGIIGMWLFQILENMGMTCGLMPITGIPLPFMSYGSSFMVVNFALLGLIGSVWSHRRKATRKVSYATTR